MLRTVGIPSRTRALALSLSLALPAFAGAQAQPAVAPAPSRTQAHVAALASPKLEGRLTGSRGADAAAAYIEAELKRIGAKPLPGTTSYRVPFTFTAGVTDEGTSLALASGRTWADKAALLALSFSEPGAVTAPAVFAGYGLRVPGDSGGFVYDSYAGLDVKDKVVVVLRYVPEQAAREQR